MAPGRLLYMRPLMAASGLQPQARAASRAGRAGWICRRCVSQQPTGPSRRQQQQSTAPPEISQSSRVGQEASNAAQEAHPTHTQPPPAPPADLASIFASPTWSVRALLPSSSPPPREAAAAEDADEAITWTTLRHLLRLSALPAPAQPGEEDRILGTLQAQLRFVRDVQSVNTRAVEPLRSIRDETSAGVAESTVTLDTLREALSRETVAGYRRRPRRVNDAQERRQSEEERLVEAAMAPRRDKRYYVVASGKGSGQGG